MVNSVASTSRGEAPAEPEVAAKKPRPKPRRKPPTGLIDLGSFAPPSDFSSTTTPAPRNAPTTALVELALPDDSRPQDIPLTIADRAKSRVRNLKSKPVSQDIIDIPSDEDERLLQLSPHRPKQKGVHMAEVRPTPDPPPPPIHPSQESLVIPTSDFQPVPAISSQLPPSDPPSSTLPLSTSTPESAKKRRRVAHASDVEESPLNPSKKRKGQRVIMDDNRTRVSPLQAIATVNQPPPDFFASSSSSLHPPPAPLVQGESRKEKPGKRNQAIDPEPPRENKRRPKPKKKSAARPGPNEVEKSYKTTEVVDDSDEETQSFALPPPPRHLGSQSPLSDLSESTSPQAFKPVTPPGKRLVPEVLITTIPRKRTSSSLVPVVEEGRSVGDEVDGSPRKKKRQKKVAEEDYFDGLDDKVEAAPKNGSKKGKGKAPPRGKSKAKPQPKEVVDDEEFEEDHISNAIETSKKGKSKAKATRSGKPRVVDSDDEVTANAAMKTSGVALVDNEQTGDSSIARQNVRLDEIAPLQDTGVSPKLVTGSETALICDFKEAQENTPPPPSPVKSKPIPNTTSPLISRKTPDPGSTSSFVRLNYSHSLATEEKAMTMTEIIHKANSAAGTPSAIKSYSSFMKGSRSVLRKIAPLHARRKTPPPLPPKPPPPKKTKKQLELEERWEEELEETIEGWGALSSQERELLRKQKRDMEMGFED